MMNRRIRSVAAASLLLACSALQNAHALGATCTASADATAFGYYSPSSPTPNDTTGNVSVTCSAAVALLVGYTIGLSPGTYGSYSQRMLGSGSNRLNYQLYTNLLHTSVWGDGTAGTSTNVGGYLLSIGVAVQMNYAVYGRIPASQNVAPGTYTDTITVLISY